MATLPPNPTDYVSMALFEWTLSLIAGWLGTLTLILLPLGGLRKMLSQHMVDDATQFARQRTEQLQEHVENIKRIADMESRLTQGQEAIRRLLESVLLKQLDGR